MITRYCPQHGRITPEIRSIGRYKYYGCPICHQPLPQKGRVKMPNGRSRRKGVRGERDIVHKLSGSARRTGYAFAHAPDITTDFAVYSVKNKTMGGSAILDELDELRSLAPQRHHYVVFKPRRGKWVIAEEISQHQGDHGEPDTLGPKE